jgi:hypothetical protein
VQDDVAATTTRRPVGGMPKNEPALVPRSMKRTSARSSVANVLAMRQAAGQLLKEIERCGYVELRTARDDARATTVHFTARGRRLLATVFELVEEIERDFAAALEPGAYDTLRNGLLRIANEVDPDGAFGSGDVS